MSNNSKEMKIKADITEKPVIKTDLSTLLKVLPKYDGSEDPTSWLLKIKLLSSLQGMQDLTTLLPLLFEGPAFQLYQNMSLEQRGSQANIKNALEKIFGLNQFKAYELFTNRKCECESIDVFFMDLKRLAVAAKITSDNTLRCALVCGLPKEVASVLRATSGIEVMNIEAILEIGRALMSERESSRACVGALNGAQCKARCYTCGSLGHYARNCTTRQVSAVVKRCYICGDGSHLANTCGRKNEATKMYRHDHKSTKNETTEN